MILNAVFVVLSIFLLIGCGMLLSKLGWIDESGAKLLARLTVNVGMAGLVVNNMLTEFSKSSLLASVGGIGVSYLSMLLTLAAGWLAARLFKIEPNRRGAFITMFGFSNAVFIGLPVAVALFGEQVTPFALIYYIANTSLFWSLGNALLARDAGVKGKFQLKKLFPIPLIAFVACIFMLLFNLTLPDFLLDTAGYLGNMVTPLSLIYTGHIIMRMIRDKQVKWRKGYGGMLLGRFLVAPAFLLLASVVFPIPSVMRGALFIQASMPVMAQTTIVAGEHGADAEYIAGGIALSTALSILTIPAYMAFLARLPW
ncbi:MAG: AEC family transporter [Clostridia bacterium]